MLIFDSSVVLSDVMSCHVSVSVPVSVSVTSLLKKLL